MDTNKWTVGAAAIAAIGSLAAAGFTAWSANSAAAVAATSQNVIAQVQAESSERIAAMGKQNLDRQADIEMVKLALNILGGESSDKTIESRTFAVGLLRRYSGISIDESSGAAWASNGTVSFAAQSYGLQPTGASMQVTPETFELMKALGFDGSSILRPSSPNKPEN